ncbi:MAG TPA: hypothetical protein VGB34_09390 [Candidatus Limnocylindria bacterium]
MKRFVTAALAASALTISLAGAASAAGEPTCSDKFEGYPHGYHIVADYVTGIGSEFLGGPGIDWPPSGLNAAGGAALPGGPGPAFHFELGVAPGASFCNDSNSPGAHL